MGETEREKGGKEGESGRTTICFSTYLCVNRLFLLCALSGNGTCNFGESGQHSNQVSYPARATKAYFLKSLCSYNLKTYRVKPEFYNWCMIKGIKLSCYWKFF